MKKITKYLLLVMLAVIPAVFPLYPSAASSGSSAENKQADSTAVVINNKLSHYMSEIDKNNEAIKTLEKELEQRRILAERLNGAVLASKEILNSITVDSSAEAGIKEQK